MEDSYQIGLINSMVSYATVHEKLEEVVLPEDRYSFHVNSISHGREICIALRPRCYKCCLYNVCSFPKTSSRRPQKPKS